MAQDIKAVIKPANKVSRGLKILYSVMGLLIIAMPIAALSGLTVIEPFLMLALHGLAAASVLRFAFLAVRNRPAWLLLAGALVIWWLNNLAAFQIDNVYPLSPSSAMTFNLPYLTVSLLFCVSATLLFISQMNRFNRIQFILDATVTVSLAAAFLWIAILEPNQAVLFGGIYLRPFVILLIIVCDSFLMTCLYLFMVTIELTKVRLPLNLVLLGAILYAAVDMTRWYQALLLTRTGTSDTLALGLQNGGYALALVLMFFGAIYTIHRRLAFPDPKSQTHENRHSNKKILLLILMPLAVLLIKGVFDLHLTMVTVGLVLLHQVFTIYVQNGIRNEYTLALEKKYNEQLETGIRQRTEELTHANRILDRMAREDNLTGLLNRRCFQDELDRLIADCPADRSVAVMYIDIDQFKTINDTYGHETGDAVLLETAGQLAALTKADALLARYGSDEFVMAMTVAPDDKDLAGLGQTILERLSRQDLLHRFGFKISAGIGIALYPRDGGDRRTIIRNAETANTHAKSLGLNHFAFFDQAINARLLRKSEIKAALLRADFDREFELHFQPQIRLADETLIGAEALLRWNSPLLGPVSPGEFIPIAEESGLILRIGNWVTEKALRQIVDWHGHYQTDLTIGINLSARQLGDDDFYDMLNELGKTIEIEAEWVDFEITEHSAMSQESALGPRFRALASSGAKISIDDFGTGYSSLSMLRQLDVDRLKIAKPLIDNIATDHESFLIVRAIIAMASALGIRTIAEGVETAEQLACLRDLGCDEIQGYYYSRPLPPGIFAAKYLQCDDAV